MATEDPFSKFYVDETEDPFAQFYATNQNNYTSSEFEEEEEEEEEEEDLFAQFYVTNQNNQDQYQQDYNLEEEEEEEEYTDPSTEDIVKGVGAEILASGAGTIAGGALGALGGPLAPITVPLGMAAGGFLGGFLGSLWAQDIEGQEEKSIGRAGAAGFVSAIPFGGAGAKAITGATKITGKMVAGAAGREAVKGGLLGGTEATIATQIDEGRMPTKEEYAAYVGGGTLFGGALGAASPKIGKSMDKFFGKTPEEIDAAIGRGEIQFNDFEDLLADAKETAPRLRADFADTRIAMESKLAADEIANKGTSKLGQAWASIKPSAYLKPKANQAAIDYSRNIKNAQDLANKIARKIKLETEKNPNIAAEIDDIIDGGNTPMSKEVYDSVGAEIQKYQDTRLEYQKEMLELVDSDAYRSMSEEGKEEFQKTLQDSIAGKTYNRQDYRMFLDKDFKPDPKLKQAALIELTEKMGSQEAAIAHLNKLENSSARTKAFDSRSKGSGQGVDSVMKRRSNPGPAERAWLGEVKESPEKVIGTLTGISKSISRAKADQTIAEELINSGVASRTRGSGDMVELTFRGTGEGGSGIYAMPEVQMALNQVYLPEVDNKTNSMVINGLQDLYRAGVAGSKASKVLLNTIAYPVQAYSNAITLAGQAINPFKGSMRGMEIALSEFGFIQDIRKSPKARRAVLDDIDEMNKYGIKGVSINDSDIRNTLDNGLFSEKLSKLSDPLGKAYSAADTMGRYVGWKSTQKTLKKQFPKAGEDLPAYKKAMADSEIAMSQGDEIGAQRFISEAQNVKDDVIKAQSAKLINDTYQNYDKLSNFVKTMSRWGVMPQFASFTAEFARNQYQQGKVIKEMLSGTYGAADNLGPANVRQMKLDGAKKLASLTAVYGSTYGLIEGVKAASGIDSSKEDALRNLVYPDYDKNKDLMVSLDEDGKTGWTANMSYISPHALGQSAFKAGMSGEDEDSLVGLVLDEMVGEGSFVAGAVFRAIENRDKYGREISNELDNYKNIKDRIEYAVVDMFKPGTYREVEKLKGSLSGDNNYTKTDLAIRQAGWRKNKFDVDKRTISTIRNNAKAGKAAISEFNFLNKKNNSPEQLNAIWEDSNRLRRDSFDSIVTNDEAMIALGRTEDDRVKLMKSAGVSGEMILDIFAREYRDLPKTTALSTSDIFSTIEGSYAQKRKQIIEIKKEDRAMGDKLLAKLSRERSADRLNLSAIDNVFLGLDTAERASRIMNHPNPKGYLNELRQKRMVSTDLNNIVRMKLRAQGQ